MARKKAPETKTISVRVLTPVKTKLERLYSAKELADKSRAFYVSLLQK